MIASTVLLIVSTLGALAVGIGATLIPSSNCVIYEKGTLSTREIVSSNGSPTGVFKPFAWNWRNELAFHHGSVHSAIKVEFQICTPHWAKGLNNDLGQYGRIYIAAIDKCLAITNYASEGPSYLASITCPDSSAVTISATEYQAMPRNYIDSRQYIVDNSPIEASIAAVQNGCTRGQWNHPGHTHTDRTHEPAIQTQNDNAGEHRLELVCQDGTKLWLIDINVSQRL